MTDLLILGLPRSGTTWVTRTLSAHGTSRLFIEPDNEKTSYLGLVKKRHHPRFPILKPGTHAPAYHSLWQTILQDVSLGSYLARRGKLQAPLHLIHAQLERHIQKKEVHFPTDDYSRNDFMQSAGPTHPVIRLEAESPGIIKSVHAVGAAAWLSDQFSLKMLWIRRHPLDILASWQRMKLSDRLRPTVPKYFPELDDLTGNNLTAEDVLSVKVLAGLLKIQEIQINHHPEWVVQDFEVLAEDPLASFKRLFAQLDMDWDSASEQFLQRSQKPGTGFATNRIAKDQTNKWVGELNPDIVALTHAAFEHLQIQPYWEKEG